MKCMVDRPVCFLDLSAYTATGAGSANASVENVQWNPVDENELAVVSGKHNEIFLYGLNIRGIRVISVFGVDTVIRILTKWGSCP